ncbi:hypothetical protein ACWEJS_06935 [Rhodococcus triatomae]
MTGSLHGRLYAAPVDRSAGALPARLGLSLPLVHPMLTGPVDAAGVQLGHTPM